MKKRQLALGTALAAAFALWGLAGRQEVGTAPVAAVAPKLRIHKSAVPETSEPVAAVGSLEVAAPLSFASINGRAVDTEGLSVAAFINRYAPDARRGNATVAYRVYKAEAMCAQRAFWKKSLAITEGLPADKRAAEMDMVARMDEACADVTPKQMEERFVFLDQAIKAGNREAVYDYYAEGPNGRDLQEVSPDDPNVKQWKTAAVSYLSARAAQGDRLAWTMLSNDYENGIMVEKDYSSAIKYVAALYPDADVTRMNFVATMAKQLPAPAVQQAIEQGRALARQFPNNRVTG